VLPGVKEREDARRDAHANFDPREHLNAIQLAAEKRSRGLLMKLKQELAGVFDSSGVSLERQFRGFDTDGDGAIDHDEFKNGLLSLGAKVTEAQIDDLITILDKDGDGEIDYQEFARWFGRGAPPPPMLPQAKAAQQAQAERTASGYDPSALLREIEKAGRARKPPPPPTPEMMARVQARESSGVADPNAHLNAIHQAAQSKAEKRSRTLMLQLKSELRSVFTMSGASLEQQFRAFDTDGDGEIDREEFTNGLLHLGAKITASQLEDLLTILDTTGTGAIDYAEFARWFGAGPPPPPVMPEMKLRQDA
jgi:Ca2+-binding EF-hand superfamily protein